MTPKIRNMSFALTTKQIQAEQKTVTRRDGWRNVQPGDLLRPVDRVMGFKKGERPRALLAGGRLIEVVSAVRQPLESITPEDVACEGFPDMTPAEFVAMYRKHGDKSSDGMVTRIEFRYVGGDQ